jgi:hypothetical protein
MAKIIYTDVWDNPNAEHPLNFLANNYVAEVVTDDGESAIGYGDTKSGAIENAASHLRGE